MTTCTHEPPPQSVSRLVSRFISPCPPLPHPVLGNVQTRWELITPEVARAFLSLMGANRPVSRGLEIRYASDMLNDQWPVTHQGIAFNVKGELIDRQHTLRAVIRSDTAHWMLVTYGLPMEAMRAIDKGRTRTAAHSLTIEGHAFGTDRGVAVARKMYEGARQAAPSSRLTHEMIRTFMDCHYDALSFTLANCTPSLAPAAVAAVIARAYYTVPQEELERFLLAVADKIPADEQRPGDKTARSLKEAIAHARGLGSSIKVQSALYCKTQEALILYRKGQERNRLRGHWDSDAFPLPKGTEQPFQIAGQAQPAPQSDIDTVVDDMPL